MRVLITLLLALALAAPAGALQPQLDEATRGMGDPFIRSLFWPGLGQIQQGRDGVGAAFAGGATLVALGFFKSHMDYRSAVSDYEDGSEGYAEALDSGDSDTAWFHYQRLPELHEAAEDRLDDRRVWAYCLAGLWAANLVDVWWHERGGPDRLHLQSFAPSGRPGLGLSLEF